MGQKDADQWPTWRHLFATTFLPGTLSFCAIVCNKSNYILKPEHLKKTRKYQLQAAKVAPARSSGRVVRLPGKSRASKSSISAANAFNLTARVPLEPIVPKHEPRDDFSSQLPQSDALQLYMREIGQVKLLTPKEEIALARRIKRGDAEAREHMIKANLRLVVKIARDYANLGLPLLDLINEGNLGLIKGVERFDPRKGAKLSTYASWGIKQ